MRGTISNLDTTDVLVMASVDPDMQSSTKTPFGASHHRSENFVQEALSLNRIRTSGLKLNIYPWGWFLK